MNSPDPRRAEDLSEPRRAPAGTSFTYADFKHWPDDERWEIIDGIPLDHTDPPGLSHARVCGNMMSELSRQLDRKEVTMLPGPFDVLLAPRDADPDKTLNIVEPDIIVTRRSGWFTDLYFHGSPELVIEVICPFRADRDLVLKLDLYERQGVREYWVFHPDEGWAMAFRRGRNGRYGRPVTLARSGTLESSTFHGLKLPLIDIFGPAPERPLRLKTERFGED